MLVIIAGILAIIAGIRELIGRNFISNSLTYSTTVIQWKILGGYEVFYHSIRNQDDEYR